MNLVRVLRLLSICAPFDWPFRKLFNSTKPKISSVTPTFFRPTMTGAMFSNPRMTQSDGPTATDSKLAE